jgi:hypothetical protein
MEDLFQRAFVVAVAAMLLVTGLLYMEYIDGPPLPLTSPSEPSVTDT